MPARGSRCVERDEGKRGIKGVIATLIRETRVERVGVHVGQVHVTAWRVLGKRLVNLIAILVSAILVIYDSDERVQRDKLKRMRMYGSRLIERYARISVSPYLRALALSFISHAL